MMAHHYIRSALAGFMISSFHCCEIPSAKCLPHFISNVLCNRREHFLLAFFDYFLAVKLETDAGLPFVQASCSDQQLWENRNGCVDY
jgi:hypothetical protein